jgi:predicted enzyme related to lactoylglutathione lyase
MPQSLHKKHTVCWVDLASPQLEKSLQFYGALFGWKYDKSGEAQMGFYTNALLDNKRVAGVAQIGKESKVPPSWSVYFATDSADEAARKVVEAGGKVLAPPMDIHSEGRMAYFSDPNGAPFGVWQGNQHQGTQLVGVNGTIVWHEVYATDEARAREFYARVFGFEAKRLPDPQMEYWTLHLGPDTVGGLMKVAAGAPYPPHWSTYFNVDDCDAAAAKVAELGGRVLEKPFDTPYGRMSAVADNFGASFCLLKPTPPQGR